VTGRIDRTEARHVKSLAALRGLSDDELVAQHDQSIKSLTPATPDYYLRELERREAGRQTETMVRMTKWMVVLTVAIAVLTVASVVFVALSSSDDRGGTTTVVRDPAALIPKSKLDRIEAEALKPLTEKEDS
jgi:hypothetical protein